MLTTFAGSYAALKSSFHWDIPSHYNIGMDVCDKWALREPARLALIHVGADGSSRHYSFAEIKEQSDRLGTLLRSLDVQPGERIGILLPQAPETAIAHVAAYKIGAIAIPLFALFGVEALEYRLHDSGTRIVITNTSGAAKLAEIRDRLPALQAILTIDGSAPGTIDLHQALAHSSSDLTTVNTRADDPAVIIYTSGTTGQPKGALHAHRVLLGHLPGVELSHNLFPQEADRIWTPADWAWIGGLLDVLLPAWHHGVAVVAHRFEKFSGEAAFQLLQDYGIRNSFLPPTALKMMRTVREPRQRWQYQLRSVASGGESLGTELLDWGRQTFGLTINEFYGQTECNMIVSSCAALMDSQPGAIGCAVIGHEIAIVDAQGQRLPNGSDGNIAVRRPDPVMFLGYWNNPQATATKFIGDWLLTGDTGRIDDAGYIRFVGRDDDVITSAGYRIGPGEIEDSILQHAAIKMVAVIGAADPQRTEIVVAVVVLNDGYRGDDTLKKELQEHVKLRLAAHEYPREIYFVDTLPMTTTGKVIRRTLREQVNRWRTEATTD